jgi:exonuclease VII small subunit
VSLSTQINLSDFFRNDGSERRRVKALESRSQWLEVALASQEEANRRWEECRTLIEQARVEIDALRVALAQAQSLAGTQTNNNVRGDDKDLYMYSHRSMRNMYCEICFLFFHDW